MDMRISKLFLLGLGGAAVAAVVQKRRHDAVGRVTRSDFAPDPDDPVQSLDAEQFHDEDLGVDAHSTVEIEADLDQVSADIAADAMELDEPQATTIDAAEVSASDVGDLYGSHTPRAVDRTHPDGDASFDQGQNWLEALETDAAEYGAEPEQPLDLADDADIAAAPHPSDTRDTPVADRGAGGPAGI